MNECKRLIALILSGTFALACGRNPPDRIAEESELKLSLRYTIPQLEFSSLTSVVLRLS